MILAGYEVDANPLPFPSFLELYQFGLGPILFSSSPWLNIFHTWNFEADSMATSASARSAGISSGDMRAHILTNRRIIFPVRLNTLRAGRIYSIQTSKSANHLLNNTTAWKRKKKKKKKKKKKRGQATYQSIPSQKKTTKSAHSKYDHSDPSPPQSDSPSPHYPAADSELAPNPRTENSTPRCCRANPRSSPYSYPW